MSVMRTKSGWAAVVAILTVFAALVLGITWRLRGELRGRVLQREAEAMHSVVLMQLASQQARQPELVELGASDHAFAAVLESSRLRGVLAVELYDRDGRLQAALPEDNVGEAELAWVLASAAQGEPVARFMAHASLAALSGTTAKIAERRGVPLLEMAIPLFGRHGNATTSDQIAHYWIDGAPLAREFALMDRGLATQAGVAFLGGAIVIVGVLLWAFTRLDAVNRKLRAQSAELMRANQELAFSARTAAIGAISAHLFHGLKNPLAGLEGFVRDGPSSGDPMTDDSWRAAMETARRLREMVNDVLAVLQDEKSGTADYARPALESISVARQKVQALAKDAGVSLDVVTSTEAEISARTANLATLVLVNLLTNAIEASPAGGRVELDVDEHEGMVEFHVRDHGAGLSAATRATLFQPTTTQKANGGGLGLAISHHLARHAGGQLELVESSGKGTIFRLLVPKFQPQVS